MDYSGDSVGVYAEAKGEYTRQLSQYLSQPLTTFFLKLMDAAKERETDPKKHLLSFQILLEGISEWNHDKVQRETQNIAMGTQCDYLEELLTAVFVAHTKVLSSIRLTNKQKKLQITIPKLEHYLHKTLIECARLLWTNTYLFSTSGPAIERQKNMRQIETLILDGINQGIRLMLPVKSILREYLSTDESDHEEEEEEDEEEEEEEGEEEEERSSKEDFVTDIKPTGSTVPVITAQPTGPLFNEQPTGPVIGTKPTALFEKKDDTVDHTFSTTSGFNPDQFDIFQTVEPLRSKSPAPEQKPPLSRPPTPKPIAQELPVIELSSVIKDDILDDAIEFEEL
jgi:hypothetical protein